MARYPGTVSTNGSAPRVTTADEWRKHREERARGKAVPLTLPSGVVIKLIRPPIQTWFGTAKLPETLSKNVINVFGTPSEETDPDKLEQAMNDKVKVMSEQDQIDLVNFMNRLLLEAVVEPQLVDKDSSECGKNEYALADLDEEERAYILFAIMSGVPDQPVLVAQGGEVSMEQLGKFRGRKRGTGTRKTGRKVPRTAK